MICSLTDECGGGGRALSETNAAGVKQRD